MGVQQALRVGFCALALAAAGCGGNQRTEDVSSAEPAPETGTPTTISASTSLDSDEDDASSLAAEILADDSVSHAEMEQALLAVVACVHRTGHAAELVEFEPGEGNEFVTSAATEEGADAADAELDRCRALYLGQVEPLYIIQHGPSVEEIEARDRAVVECLVQRGHDVAGMTLFQATQVVGAAESAFCSD